MIVVCSGLGSAGSILVGKALGNEAFAQVKEAGRHIFRWSLLLGTLSGAFLQFLRATRLIIADLSENAAALFGGMILINAVYCIGKFFNSCMVGGIFCAGGDTRFGLICDTIAMWGVVLPLGYAAAFVWKWTPIAVYAVLYLDELVKLPFVIRRFLQYKWIKNLTSGKEK